MKNKTKKIEVSIVCLTYNQEKYIKKCIESLLNQNVDFNYEIIIHDDASTDKTTNIIKEYENKYPNIIKPIYEKENQYSKNSQKVFEIALAKARGKYIAICEGDDYWINPNKLSMQKLYLENNPECTVVAGDYEILEKDGKITRVSIYNQETNIKIPDFLKRTKQIQTATLFYRKNDLLPLPNYYYNAHVGDLPTELHLINKGYLHYIPEVLSVYRYQAEGSFSLKNKNNIARKRESHQKTVKIYEEFDESTNYKYHKEIQEFLLEYNFNFFLSIDDLKEIKKKSYQIFYNKISFKRKLKLYLKNNKIIKKAYSIVKGSEKNGRK